MGQDVDDRSFTREDRTRYRAKVRRCLDVFARMLSERDFSVGEPQIGVEIEFNLVDEVGDPAMKNAEALEAIAGCSTSRSTSRRSRRAAQASGRWRTRSAVTSTRRSRRRSGRGRGC